MSTPNFARTHFSSVYAIETDDDFQWDWEMEALQDSLENLLPKCFQKTTTLDSHAWIHGAGYQGAQILGSCVKHVGKWEIAHHIVAMSGYYGGVNLDVCIAVVDGSAGCETYRTEDGTYDREVIAGEHNILPASVVTAIEQRDRRIERALEKITIPLRVRGIFSNGEAVYEPKRASDMLHDNAS